MRKILLTLAILLTVYSSSAFGFPTLANAIKGEDTIVFNSNIPEMDVYLNGQMVGKYMNASFSYNPHSSSKCNGISLKRR